MNRLTDRNQWADQHARRTDPETSHKAAKVISYKVGSHKARILQAMSWPPQPPLQSEEIAALSGLTDAQVWRRLPDLENDGKIRSTGKTRKKSSGCDARLWVSSGNITEQELE